MGADLCCRVPNTDNLPSLEGRHVHIILGLTTDLISDPAGYCNATP
jgi:hypothetical protein